MPPVETTEVTAEAHLARSASERRDRRAGRIMVGLVVLGLVGLVAYFTTGMPGMDHGMDDVDLSAPIGLSPGGFAARADDPGVFVVNVHVPDEGGIAGTDAVIPYDAIAESDALPADKDATVLLYCKTGRMSADAVRDLRAAGYTNVSHLIGGMDAWKAAGRPLVGEGAAQP